MSQKLQPRQGLMVNWFYEAAKTIQSKVLTKLLPWFVSSVSKQGINDEVIFTLKTWNSPGLWVGMGKPVVCYIETHIELMWPNIIRFDHNFLAIAWSNSLQFFTKMHIQRFWVWSVIVFCPTLIRCIRCPRIEVDEFYCDNLAVLRSVSKVVT